jgi:aminocarboxymuconate-semialdehyde decarboxylase
VPYIRSFDDPNNLRLIILPGEDSSSTPSTSRGRPVGPSYWNIEDKINFMDQHDISISVMSLANPWLDFVTDEKEAIEMAVKINDWINEAGDRYPGRIFGFGVLPMGASVPAIQDEIRRIKGLKNLRGVVMGTTGRGKGLDDPDFVPVWQTLEDTEQITFLHPHYGLPVELYGPQVSRTLENWCCPQVLITVRMRIMGMSCHWHLASLSRRQ